MKKSEKSAVSGDAVTLSLSLFVCLSVSYRSVCVFLHSLLKYSVQALTSEETSVFKSGVCSNILGLLLGSFVLCHLDLRWAEVTFTSASLRTLGSEVVAPHTFSCEDL